MHAFLSQQSEHARGSCLLQDCIVCNAVLTGDDQNPSDAAHVEGVESALLPKIHFPCFPVTAVEQRAEYAVLVHLHVLVLMVSMELSHTLFARQATAVASLPILVFSLHPGRGCLRCWNQGKRDLLPLQGRGR